MTKTAIISDALAPSVGPFSSAIRAGGLIYFSGQIALDRTGKLVAGDAARQTEQILANMQALLEAAGRSFADVLRVGVYLTDMKDFAAMNAVYAKHFGAPFPARTTIGVASLPLGAAVEIDCIVQGSATQIGER